MTSVLRNALGARACVGRGAKSIHGERSRGNRGRIRRNWLSKGLIWLSPRPVPEPISLISFEKLGPNFMGRLSPGRSPRHHTDSTARGFRAAELNAVWCEG